MNEFWADGFECYAAAGDLAAEYNVAGGVSFTANGRNGGRCIEFSSFGSGNTATRLLSNTVTDVYAQAATIAVIGTGTQVTRVFEFQNTSGTPILTVEKDASGFVVVRRGGFTTGTVLATGSASIQSSYRLVEVHAVIHASTGSVEVRVDGVVDINISGVNTEGAVGGCDRVMIGGASGFTASTNRYDDFAVYYGLGGFVGDFQDVWLPVDGTSAEQDFPTLVGAATAHEALDEVPQDGDTSYIESATVADRARLTLANYGGSGVGVLAVIPRACVKQPIAGASQVKLSLYDSGNETQGPARVVTTAYTTPSFVVRDKPGGSGFVLGDLASLEVVIEHA